MRTLTFSATETPLKALLTWKLQAGPNIHCKCGSPVRSCCHCSPPLWRGAGLGCARMLDLSCPAAGRSRGCSIPHHSGLHRQIVLQAERVLDGQWKLVYTSNSELFGLLALSRLPFVAVGDITQTVQASTLTVENKVRHGRRRPAHASIECWTCESFPLECVSCWYALSMRSGHGVRCRCS